MSYLLFLDDIRDPSWVHWCTMPRVPDSDWAIVRNHDQFVALVEREGIPALVAFDHDLDAEGMLDESRNGMDCLQWLWQHCQQQAGLAHPESIISYGRAHTLKPHITRVALCHDRLHANQDQHSRDTGEQQLDSRFHCTSLTISMDHGPQAGPTYWACLIKPQKHAGMQ